MTINLSPAFRLAIYVIGSVGTLITGYLFTKGFIGREEVALWGGFVALAFGLAGFNVPTGGARNESGFLIPAGTHYQSAAREAARRNREGGHVDLAVVLLVGIVVVLVLVLLGRV